MPPKSRNDHRAKKGEVSSVVGAGRYKIKRKIRDLERLLTRKRDELPANVIIEKERALAALQVELKNAEVRQKVQELSKRYHMVKFFEKTKALRRYKKAKKEFDELVTAEADKKDIKKSKKKLHHCEIDLVYAVNFPRTEKYISLYPTADSENERDENAKKGSLKTEEKRNQLKKNFEQLMKENALPVSLEEILEGKTLDSKNISFTHIEAPDAAQGESRDEDNEDQFFE